MRDKRDVMRLHLQNGISGLDNIRESYNTFANGGKQVMSQPSPDNFLNNNIA
jgi:hypothetical protein